MRKSIKSTSEKHLGIIVNNTITWKHHIFGDEDNSGLIKDLSKRIGICKQLRKYMPNSKFKQVVTGIFTSKLIYGITVWGGVWGLYEQENNVNTSISKEAMRKLQVCQNKILRLLTGLDYETPTKVLLEKTNQLSVHQLVAYHTACQLYKISKSQLPAYHFNRLFRKNENGIVECKNIQFNLTLGKSNFFYQSSKIWSALPVELKEAPTIHSFKRKCRIWTKSNISIRP